jgi:hypothetical protein
VSEPKPREWYIVENGIKVNHNTVSLAVDTVQPMTIGGDSHIHVIEKSAYGALKAENESYRALLLRFLELSEAPLSPNTILDLNALVAEARAALKDGESK